jgi:hypothetical protein
MIELFILWNVAALRSDQQEDTDFSSGLIAVWIMLQIFIWPLSIFLVLWKRFGLKWFPSFIIAGSTLTWGWWLLGGENFFFGMGMLAMVAAASVVAHYVTNE